MVRLLVPFDGSPAALRAVELVAGYQGDKSAIAVTLLNVQARPPSLWPSAGVQPGAVDEALLEAAQHALAPALERLQAASLEPHAAVRLGLPAQIIVREAETHGASVIAMGTRGLGALHGFALGSVALRVAHGGATPVLLVKPEDRVPAALGRRLRVMLAMDGSEPALRAAERLVALRTWLGELEVHLLYAQQPLSLLRTIMPPHDDVLRQWSTAEGEKATAAARELLRSAGVRQHLHLTFGDPALELTQLAEQVHCELITLGTRGLGAAHHALVGSTALKAAVLGRVPVLLVP
jgi:nucleotide-binding universal stress UspA family protein